ncbi:MAG: bifunctional methylenetetrahydrofolate dehydrogenase/methenyltetrahydrofolate cyclohydrolase FolD [Limnochordia bacterium]|nr:bifunctional methylenetetrahydrofolate dehydrogenase/methenyltetrahydrofolate cyclohydrolase FolD [Bacillota bacterium]HOB09648.1 bifunctional methylenetetrahydrofolate dehydrogenase/methenyltetrahydrofolate cyclohydrolase FolD [Limnochordia bacterium]NLH31738.1 bifunctional methylenetetrahydrofolate dehydrogenase/methenyltetrahydrofolate cyclohydrolase FolD [Bacillota bacterium]HPT93316.1 bifunctional methylenetetrahydrofolate dehydrogenase/methenyltetrahydrofolate cyclohydrolase FolD [Limno
MAAQIIDGKQIAQQIRSDLARQIQERIEQGKPRPGLAVVLVGDNPASQLYVKMKQKACLEVGIHSEEHRLPASISQGRLLGLIDQLNSDPRIHGILVQLPLPDGLDEEEVIMRIRPEKDVDGFHPINVGRLAIGADTYVPCTPAGVMKMLDWINYDPAGKKAVVVGRSNIVGKPVAQLLLKRNATVTICHSHTKDLMDECRQADILVAAVGRPQMIKADWVKPGAAVIDVGINKIGKKTVGDVDFDNVKEVAGWITPVPGGVGPMTIAMLLANTVRAAG